MLFEGVSVNLPPVSDDEGWMRLALEQAQQAAAQGEVPVGAVVVQGGQLVAAAGNAPRALCDPSAHAEVLALRAAAQQLGNYRLPPDATLYVTLEPCAMCAGALLHARVGRVVFGAADPKAGAAGSVLDVLGNVRLNAHAAVQGGVLAGECGALLQEFFRARRNNPEPLREDALRTPDERFAALPDLWPPHYVQDLPALDGLRMHYLDSAPEADADAPALLLLHAAGRWSYAFTCAAQAAHAAGWRVLAPDFIGFGRSDKPKKAAWHASAPHAAIVLQWLESLGVQRLAWHGDGLGRRVGEELQRAAPQLQWLAPPPQLQAWLALDKAANADDNHPAWRAPFPDDGHRAALRHVE